MDPVTFGSYKILRKLLGGGMGRVYLADDSEQNRRVALKLIDLGTDPDSLEVLDAERRGAELQRRLSLEEHRVVLIYQTGEREGYFYIVMEYVEGQDLSELLAAAPLSPEQALPIAINLCEVLDRAHRFQTVLDGRPHHGIVHGDIKPRNIRITPQNQVKVLDFGIAKALSMTRRFTRNQFGSIAYSSPERLNTGQVDRASDLWSVAVVLYEMLASRPLFQAPSAELLEHTLRSYQTAPALPQNWPAPLRAVLLKALSPDPSQRQQSAAELAADLRAVQAGRLIESVPAVGVETTQGFDSGATRRTPRLPALPDGVGDSTRRTSSVVTPPPLPAGDSTRRTVVPPAPHTPIVLPARPVSRSAPATVRPTPTWRRVLQFGFLVLVLGLAYHVYGEGQVWRQADQFRRELESEQWKDMNGAWARYAALSERTYLPEVTLSVARRPLNERLIRQADRVIEEYRQSDNPTVVEGDWKRAHDVLQKALQLNPSDRSAKGKLLLCEGHIDRINGGRGQGRRINEAKAEFEQARTLLPKSPDPFLGLARLAIYNFHDVERAEDYLREADRRDHPWGRREKAMLADGYRERGDSLFREAQRAQGSRQERDFLQRAADDYRRAEELYQTVAPYGGATTQLRRLAQSRDQVGQRLEQLKGQS